MQIKELREISETNVGLKIGASVTLAELEEAFGEQISTKLGMKYFFVLLDIFQNLYSINWACKTMVRPLFKILYTVFEH